VVRITSGVAAFRGCRFTGLAFRCFDLLLGQCGQ
jgi:hypothetical protein